MKGLVYTGTMETEFRDVPEPKRGEDQVIVDLSFCGICGSDMHAWHGHDARRVPPLVLGHEATGIALNGHYEGKRVAINPLMTCGVCYQCRNGMEHLCSSRELIGMRVPGAFAERVSILERNLFEIPDYLSLEAASLSEPLACAVHAVRLATDRLGPKSLAEPVVVLGGGAIGLLSAKVLSHYGARAIWLAETNDTRAKILSDTTDAKIFNPASGEGPEIHSASIVVDAVGIGATRAAASRLVRSGGVIVHVGLQDNSEGLDTRRITLQEISFLGSYCYTRKDFREALNMLANGIVKPEGWAEMRPLSKGGSGFTDIHNGCAAPKIILNCKET